MVVGAFPLAKLGALLIRQISKPLSNVLVTHAKSHPFFRKYVIMPPAQFYNWCEVKAKMWILNLGRPVNIPVLSQEMATELGANLLGEGFIFFVASTVLILEYNRQSRKEEAKEIKKKEEMDHITDTLTELYFSLQTQQTQIRELERKILSMDGKTSISDKSDKSSGQQKGCPPVKSPPGGTPPTPVAGAPSIRLADNNIRHVCDVAYETGVSPYPNRGIILRSLNYIQMDILSAFNYSRKPVVTQSSPSKTDNTVNAVSLKSARNQNSLLNEALNALQYDFRSLF